MRQYTRRQFIKSSVLAGSAITAFPGILTSYARNSMQWDKLIVHPHVDNLKVVSVNDPHMAPISRPICDWATQDRIVVPEVVADNFDKLACALTEKNDSDKAWSTIFLKPPQKSWADTVVGIKTNNIAYQHTRSATLGKICRVLINTIGVTPSNIHIYDAKHGGDMQVKTPFSGLPGGCRVESNWGGITAQVVMPKPWKNGTEKSRCLSHLADGTVDILINIAVCKGHNERFGGFSLTMKNHLGSFWPTPVHQEGGGLDYIIAVNKTHEIIGNIDEGAWKVPYPRQQLCIVDALWASKDGPGGFPSSQPNFLAMGVFAPVVDYVVATQFRAATMGWKVNKRATDRFLSDFGYQPADLSYGGRLIEI